MYVITGATGNTGHEIAEGLLKKGKKVTVISRSAEKLKALIDKGAISAVGDLEDETFLNETFKGATAVYAIIPPKLDLTDWLAYQLKIANAITNAVKHANVKYVVTLSSMGSHRDDSGPVKGLGEFEKLLDAVDGLNVLHLRPGYFMQNLFGIIGMIKSMDIIGYSLNADVRLPMTHTSDVAKIATKRLLELDFTGSSKEFVAGAEDLDMNEVTAFIGNAIGKPDLKYVAYSYTDAKAVMMQMGLPEAVANGYNELFKCLNEGNYLSDFVRTKENTTKSAFAQFVKNEFAPAYLHA